MTASIFRSLRTVGDELACRFDDGDRFIIILQLDDETQTYREAVGAGDAEQVGAALAAADDGMFPEYLIDTASPLDSCVFDLGEDGTTSEHGSAFSEQTLPFVDGAPAA